MAHAFRTVQSVGDIAAEVWNGLANPNGAEFNPLVSHSFFMACEASGSATPATGWTPTHLILEDEGRIIGLAPCYLKTHSMGEYVFDHAFADAYHRAGGRYYPKLQCSVPFSPVTGPRLFAPTIDLRVELARGLLSLAAKTQVSSLHLTFVPNETVADVIDLDFLPRNDIQFHWNNAGYNSFDDFLGTLSSSKRKNIRKERHAVRDRGITFEHVTGAALTEQHWDHFFEFYTDTGARKWGKPYLTRSFFSLLSQTMAEYTLLILAKREGKIIAGALNFIGSHRLFGRNWGCAEDHPFLHFETCYYQAIDFAIAHGLQVVEAGAQGEHKLARGYVPVKTNSLHHFAHTGLSRAVAEYLEAERAGVDQDQKLLAQHLPFRQVESE